MAGSVQGFDPASFERQASEGLQAHELKARIAHVAGALSASLAGPFETDAPRVAQAVSAAGLSMWAAWPAVEWVAVDGLEDPRQALDALGQMTGTASAEFAIRPFIERHPEVTWRRLGEWAAADDEHRRRLASEGTRPRLPWGRKVAALDSDPHPGLGLLDRLREDESEYVRRSVANHLNDIARSEPDLAIATATRWSEEGGRHVGTVVRHALRGLVKRGDPRALALVGADVDAKIDAQLALDSQRAEIGGAMPFSATIQLGGDESARAVIDYAVLYARRTGRASRKVFKLATVDLDPGRPVCLRRKVKLADVSIRRHHPGEHTIELLVNGQVAARASFELVQPGRL